MPHPTVKKENWQFSIKKYVIDNLKRNDGIEILTDRFQAPSDPIITRWCVLRNGTDIHGTFKAYTFELYAVTRKDPESIELIRLCDKITDYFLSDTSITDGYKRIPFYDKDTKEVIGQMLVTDFKDSDEINGPDQSKFKIYTIIVKMAVIS